jgi:hypothetical protein
VANATLIYETNDGKKHSKKVAIPEKHHHLGLYKQRDGVVVIGYFKNQPLTHGFGKDNYIIKNVPISKNAKGGSARLKVGIRTISKAK